MHKNHYYADGLPYYSLNQYLRDTFGRKLYKLSLDAGMTCPNRDGTLGTGGCIFCHGGSGDFAEGKTISIAEQIEKAKARIEQKWTPSKEERPSYIAYFQSYTNTYAPVEVLREIFTDAIRHPDIAALSIGTRPDCLSPTIVELLDELNHIKPVWIELGLQSIHEKTADFIHRGYPLSVFEDSVRRLKDKHIIVIVHVILGLPSETREEMLATVRYLGEFTPGIDGIKLQLLHVLKETELAVLYEKEPFPVFSMEEYMELLLDCIRLLPRNLVIHRISGDGPKAYLIAPLWSGNKRLFLNRFRAKLKASGAYQGEWITP